MTFQPRLLLLALVILCLSPAPLLAQDSPVPPGIDPAQSAPAIAQISRSLETQLKGLDKAAQTQAISSKLAIAPKNPADAYALTQALYLYAIDSANPAAISLCVDALWTRFGADPTPLLKCAADALTAVKADPAATLEMFFIAAEHAAQTGNSEAFSALMAHINDQIPTTVPEASRHDAQTRVASLQAAMDIWPIRHRIDTDGATAQDKRRFILYLIAHKENWLDALIHMRRGANPELQALAQPEWWSHLNSLSDLSIGHAWWKFSESQTLTQLESQSIKRHACLIYEALLPLAQGKDAQLIESRLKQAKALPPVPAWRTLGNSPPTLPDAPSVLLRPDPDATPLYQTIPLANLITFKPVCGHYSINNSDQRLPVLVAGKPATSFIFAHTPSAHTYFIPPGAIGFHAVGVRPAGQDFPGINTADWRYIVNIDGKQAFVSKSILDCAGQVPIFVPIPEGAKRIQLVIDPMGSTDYDWSYWANPQFLTPGRPDAHPGNPAGSPQPQPSTQLTPAPQP